mmetsp:Transcript_120089/g.340480  ORF Transcript_120089/g.340480 Transcript_120089/m.340480 type:complete len:719 (-) Transcript_120089:145-2301(-)
MAALSRFLSTAAVLVLLRDLPALLHVCGRRGRRCLKAQVQFVAVFWLLRRAASPAWRSLQHVPAVQAAGRLWESSVGTLISGVTVPAMLAAAGLPFALGRGGKPQQRWLMRALIYGSAPTILDAIEERFGEDVDTIAVLAFELGLLMGEHAAAAVILLMLSGGEALEHYAFVRARHGLEHILNRDPPKAHRLRTSAATSSGSADAGDVMDIEDLDAADLQSGDVLVVRTGEVVPVDGQLRGGGNDEAAVVDEGLLTGEAGGTTKYVGDPILSGSVALKPLQLVVTTPFVGSTLELMRQALQDALERKGQLQQRSASAASLLKPLTLFVAAFALLVRLRKPTPGMASRLMRRRWSVVLSVLMSATPCPASIGVPVAFLSGINVAARHGVLIKSGAAIESLARASHVVLDKTGTLTCGTPTVRCFEVRGFTSSDAEWREALQLVASVELLSTHPLATALCKHAEAEGLDLLPAEDHEHVYGCGVAGTVGGRRVSVGTLEFVNGERGCTSPTNRGRANSGALLEVHFSVGEGLTGHALFEDPLREGGAAAVAKLRSLGLRVSILSGDRSAHLPAVAQQVGVDDAHGGCLPQEKARLVRELAADGGVIMVGDEGNDAPALAAADVGISVGTSGLASQSADVVVAAHPSASALERVAHLVTLSRKVVATAGRGVRCGLSVSAVQVAAAGTGRIPPRVNAVLQEVVDLSALTHAASVLGHRWAR